MSTRSTVPTVKQRLATLLADACTVPVTYAWPGKSTAPEAVFLGPHPETADVRLDRSSQVPTIKAGRKQRQEEYTVRITVWSFRGDLTSDGAQECEQRAFDIANDIEDAVADDPRLGLAASVIQHATIDQTSSTLFPFNAGWACELAIDLLVAARLQ